MQCLDIHYIELVEERLLLEPTLNSKVCYIGGALYSILVHFMLYAVYGDRDY